MIKEGYQPYIKRAIIQGYCILNYIWNNVRKIDIIQISSIYPLLLGWFATKLVIKKRRIPIIATWHDLYSQTVSIEQRKLKSVMNHKYFKTKPYQHQLDCFNESKDHSVFAILLEQGLGKTKVVLDTVSYLIMNEDIVENKK